MNTTPNPTTPDTVVLIHGLWLNARSWDPWVDRYEQRGLNVIATSWPGMDDDIAALRTDTSGFDDLGIEAILDHYTQIINGLAQPPIIIGHSFGGAFTQVLIDRGDDHTAPQSTNESNYRHYKSDAVTELKVYPGRAHFHVGLEGWEDVADYAIDWSLRHAR